MCVELTAWSWFNTLRPWQNGYHSADEIFKSIFLIEIVQFQIHFRSSLQFTLSSIGLYNGLASNRRPAIIRTINGLVYWRIFASRSLDGVMCPLWRTFGMPVIVASLFTSHIKLDIEVQLKQQNVTDSQHGAHQGQTGPRLAPWWPHEIWYLG